MLEFIVNSFIALGLIAIGIRNFLMYLFRRKLSSVKGKVVSFKKELDAEYFVKYPVIKYSVGNKDIIVQADFGMSIFNWKIGDEIQVYYKPDAPNEYFLWDFRIKILSGIIIVVGVIFLIVGFRFL